jgi:cobalt-zinc-cadmium efflux system membrane fusion protein
LLVTAACSKEAPEEVESATVVPVTVGTAQTASLTATVHATGVVTPAPGAELLVVAPEAGRIAAIPKAEGDTVHRGDVLVRFEIPSATAEAAKQRAEIARAQARLTNARAAQVRARDLFDRGVAARKEVEDADKEIADAEADLAGAQAAATAAETVAARSVVRATFDGIIARRSHNPGDLVDASASDPVLRVIDPRRLEVQASVPVGDAPRIALGATARLTGTRPGGPPPPTLKVVSRPAAVQANTATVGVRLAFTSPVNYAVGTPVQLAIDAEHHPDAVVVPASAVVREGESAAVFVPMNDKAQRRPVTLGLENDEQVEIAGGLRAGEPVITNVPNGLPDGAKITRASAHPAAAADDKGDAKDDEK